MGLEVCRSSSRSYLYTWSYTQSPDETGAV
jgi:hypothetical protein